MTGLIHNKFSKLPNIGLRLAAFGGFARSGVSLFSMFRCFFGKKVFKYQFSVVNYLQPKQAEQ